MKTGIDLNPVARWALVVGVTVMGLGIAAWGQAPAPEEATPPPASLELAEAERALQTRAYQRAIDLLSTKVADEAHPLWDYALYLTGLSHFHAGRHAEAAAACARLVEGRGESAWRHKARFLQARALVEQRRHAEAEAIYAAEAARLFSEDRKRGIAVVLVDFADGLSRQPDPDEVGAPPPDHRKAHALYRRVLDLEIGRDLRDTVEFKAARALQLSGQYAPAEQAYRDYLDAFDPLWSGAVGSSQRHGRRLKENPPPAGRHRAEARYQLALCQLAQKEHGPARTNAEDLIALLEAGADAGGDAPGLALPADRPGLLAEARYLLVKTFDLQNPDDLRLGRGVAAARRFLELHPAHTNANAAALLIAVAYQKSGRTAEAIAAYEDFAAGRNYRLPGGEAMTTPDRATGKTPLEVLEEKRQEAAFQIGQLKFQQKDYPGAVQQWQLYLARYPNGAHWSRCQSGIIDAEFQIGLDAVAAGKEELARRHFDVFLKQYPLDGRARQILFTLGQMHFVRGLDLAEKAEGAKDGDADDVDAGGDAAADAFRRAVEAWGRLVSKYPKTEEAGLALLRTGMIYEEHLGDLEAALATYRKLTWGSSRAQAQGRVAAMTQKQLLVRVERTFRTGEPARVAVDVRNIEKLTFKQYNIGLEAFFRKAHGLAGIGGLDIDLIEPDHTWEVPVDGYAPYRPIDLEVDVPLPEGPGACVINVGEEDWEATVLVLRTDLELIVKTDRKEALVYVENRRLGRPAGGVDVLLSDGEKVFASGATGDDGVFRGHFPRLAECGQLAVFARAEGGVAVHGVGLAGLQVAGGLTPKGYLYTAKPAYRPGETVGVRGIIREAEEGSYRAPPEARRAYVLAVRAPNGRLLEQRPVTLSDLGTFHATFALPAGAPAGDYALTAARADDAKISYSGRFQVGHFELQKLRLAIDFERRVVFRGELIEGAVAATYAWGAPASGLPVTYSLPDGTVVKELTGEDGRVPFTFDPSGFQPGRVLGFTAAADREGLTVSGAVTLAELGFAVAVEPAQPVALAGEPFEVTVKTTGAEGKPVGRALTLTVLKTNRERASRVLQGVPWVARPAYTYAEVSVSQHKVETDPETGVGTVTLTIDGGGSYTLRAAGEDRFQQAVTGDGRVTVSGDDDATKLRFFTGRQTYSVGEEVELRLHSRAGGSHALITFEGEGIIAHRVLQVRPGHNPLTFTVDHPHFPNFRVAAAMIDGRELRVAAKDFTVERELRITLTPGREPLPPGAEGAVTVRTVDQLGRPVPAELSLAVVNDALYRIYPETAPPMVPFFQAEEWRQARLNVASNCGFSYTGQTRPVLRAVADEGQRVAQQQQRGRGRQAAAQAGQGFFNGEALYGNVGNIVATNLDASGTNIDVSGTIAAFDDNANGVAQVDGGTLVLGLNALNAIDGVSVQMGAQQREVEHYGFNIIENLGFDDVTTYSKSVLSDPGQGALQQTLSAFFASPEEATAQLDAAGVRLEDDTAHRWFPDVVTDASGEAMVTVRFPATAGRWRLTARGCTAETLVGEATAEAVTREDFFVELQVPPAAREGDRLRLLARVHNLTGASGEAAVSLEVKMSGGKVAATSRRSVAVPAEGVAECVFEAFAVPSGATLLLPVATARMGEHEDAVAEVLAVEPWGMDVADFAGGVAGENVTVSLTLPAGRDYSSRRLDLTLAPSVQRLLVDLGLGRGAGAGRSSGLGPSAASQLLAAASALSYARDRGAGAGVAPGVPDADLHTLRDRARTLAAALVVGQADDGGWRWRGPGGVSQWVVAARSLWALAAARAAGVEVQEETTDAAETFLKKVYQNLAANDRDAKAVLQHALATAGKADFAACNRLYRERDQLSSTALAHLANAFLDLERPAIATELVALLRARAEKAPGGRGSYWPAGESTHRALRDSEDTTAVALLALARTAAEGAVDPLAREAGDYLLARGGCSGFASPRAVGSAVAALAAHHAAAGAPGGPVRFTLELNGEPWREVGAEEAAAGVRLSAPAELLREGENVLRIVRREVRGNFSYAAVLTGFSNEFVDPNSWTHPHIVARYYYHDRLTYRGHPIKTASTSPVSRLEHGQRVRVRVDVLNRYSSHDYLVWEEPLPAGCSLVPGSVSGGGYTYLEQGRSSLRLFYPPGTPVRDLEYEIVARVPGVFRVPPPVLRDAVNPSRMRLGAAAELTVLPPGEESPDPYEMNPAERFELASAHFNDGLYPAALAHLDALQEANRSYQEREVARMLLWIMTEEGHFEGARVVDNFEVLRERHPDLYIPFDKILAVGRAYREIGEHERAWLVFLATIESSFLNDANISAVLEDQGQFLASIAYTERLWREYPDSPDVVAAHFALSQALYQKAPEAEKLAAAERLNRRTRPADRADPEEKEPTRESLLVDAVRLLHQFLTHYPEDALADDAAFSMANAFFALKDYARVVRVAEAFRGQFGQSDFATSFQYMAALGHLWQLDFEAALESARPVADAEGPNRDYARYIMAQIFHAEGSPADAIAWYRKVKDLYPDAAEAIDYFEQKRISVAEVNAFKPGEPAELKVGYRNLKEAFIQVYKVDLMKLYLREKNLSTITRVNLAGFEPAVEQRLELEGEADYRDRERGVLLPLEAEGAYLVICRGDHLFTSGLVLITPLQFDVQEDPDSGVVRVNLRDRIKDRFLAGVHVKAIGSDNNDFKAGETDLRGIFEAGGLQGTATIIARAGESRYAFYRGTRHLGAVPAPNAAPGQAEGDINLRQRRGNFDKSDYLQNLDLSNTAVQGLNIKNWDELRRGAQKGVQVKKARR